ncbi:MAG TPA: ribonuclease HII [Candidatus Saccharimonadales bacterium]|nr:ribonuclease HII [Candidatus Saccharimonadales bacterium]
MRKKRIKKKLYEIEQEYWLKGLQICGMDEVGRGCLAGPVVTCAVILFENVYHSNLIDSKKLTQPELQEMYQWLLPRCIYNIAINSSRIIDAHNIYQTTAMTMKSSLLHLFEKAPQLPSLILIDAMPINLASTPYSTIEIRSFTQGESKSASIAAASIIAKVTRDAIVTRMNEAFPSYGLARHKGYATKSHQACLHTHQASIIHRKAYLKKFLTNVEHEQQSLF